MYFRTFSKGDLQSTRTAKTTHELFIQKGVSCLIRDCRHLDSRMVGQLTGNYAQTYSNMSMHFLQIADPGDVSLAACISNIASF